jgi:formate hydrogenlyase subunit 6/NADH:ubiquinone oxidoreductase subunit I
MQLSWLAKGLRTGIVTSQYPASIEPQPAGWRGCPVFTDGSCTAADGCDDCIAVCLPQALRLEPDADGQGTSVILDYGRCVMCGLCETACSVDAVRLVPAIELAVTRADELRVKPPSNRLHHG